MGNAPTPRIYGWRDDGTRPSATEEPQRTGIAGPGLLPEDRELLAEPLRVALREEVECRDQGEAWITRQKGFDQILLVPQTHLVHDPPFRVVARSEDVVNLDEDARREQR